MSLALLHHSSILKKCRSTKYQPVQETVQPGAVIPFNPDYVPKALVIGYAVETNGPIGPSVEIVNLALRVDPVSLTQLLKIHKIQLKCRECDCLLLQPTTLSDPVNRHSDCCLNCMPQETKVTVDSIDGQTINWFETLVQPVVPITDFSTQVHGISNEDVAKAPVGKSAAIAVVSWLSKVRNQYGLPESIPLLLTAHDGHNHAQLVLQLMFCKASIKFPPNLFFGDIMFSIRHEFGYSWSHGSGDLTLAALVRRVCNRSGFKQEYTALRDTEATLSVMSDWKLRTELFDGLWNDRQSALVEKQLEQATGALLSFRYTAKKRKSSPQAEKSEDTRQNEYKRQKFTQFMQKKKKPEARVKKQTKQPKGRQRLLTDM